MPAIDGVIGELRGEGVVDSHGRFTLDPAKAREKMRRFQLADPRRYVLELVQAAQLRGATKIDFTIDADDMWMRFDGRPFTADELSDLYASLFADGEDNDDLRALRQLALGVNAAMGMEPRRVRVESGGVGMELRLDDADAIEVSGADDGITLAHVKKRLRPRVFLDFFRKLVGLLGEERHIRERCLYAGLTITLNGKVIADGQREIAHAMASISLEGEGYRGRAAYVAGTAAELRLVKDGVWISSHPLEEEVHGLVVVIEDSRLRKDVSMAKIVEDEAFKRVLGACVDARWRVLDALVSQYEEIDPAYSKLMGGLWRDAIERYGNIDGIRDIPVLRKLAGFVTWPSARGPERLVSLLELLQSYDAKGQLGYGRRRVEELSEGDEPTPVITDLEDLVWLRGIFGDKMLQRVDLNRELRRMQGEASFRARKVATELDAQLDCVARVRLQGRFRGEAGLRGAVRESVFWLVKDGSLLCKLELQLPVRGLVVVAEGDFQANELYDDVVRDETFAGDMFDLIAGGIDLLADALAEATVQGIDSSASRGMMGLVKHYLTGLFSKDTALTLLRRMDYGKRAWELKDELAQRLLPRLGVGRCPGTCPHALAKVQLFSTVGGERRSLVEIAERHRASRGVPFIGPGIVQPASTDGSILVLGRGDRQIIAGIFGEDAMEDNLSRVAEAAREAGFMRKLPFDFTEDFRYRTAVTLPIGRVKELTPLVTVFFGSGEEARGYVGLAPNRIDDSPADIMDVVVTRLVLHGRSLCEHAFSLGVGPCFAAIADDRLSPTSSWDNVVENGALEVVEATLVKALAEVLRSLCEAFTELSFTDLRWARRILLHALASAAKGGPVPLPELAQTLPLVGLLNGDWLSLDQLRARLAETKVIEHVNPGRFPPRVGEQVVVVDEQGLADLAMILSEARLVDGGPRLTLRTHAGRLRSRPRAPESPSLPPDEVISVEGMVGDGAEGVIGLPRRLEAGLLLDLCSLGRHVGTYVIPECAPLRAFFIDPKLPLTVGAQADLDSERVSQIVRWCRRRIPALIAAAAERWDDLDEADRDALWVHMRPLFVDAQAREGRRVQVGWQAVRGLPLFEGVDGDRWSIEALEQRCRGRRLRWVTAAVEGVRLGEGPVVILNEEERTCLEALFVLERFDAHVVREEELIAGGAQQLAEVPPEGALISRRSVAAGGMRCLMWLPAEFREDLELDFGVDGLVFASAPASPYLRCGGAVACVDPCAVEALEERQLVSLAKQAAGLYESLCARLESGRVAMVSRPVAIRYLRSVSVELDRHASVNPSRWQVRLGDRIARALPALPGEDRPTRKKRERRKSGSAESMWKPVADKPELETEAPSFEPVSGSSEEVVLAEVGSANFVVPGAGEGPRAVLLRALAAQLRLARVHRVGLLSDLNLSRLLLGSSHAPEVAESTERGVEINARHPMVALALTQVEETGAAEEMLLGALASAVYTVVNWQAEAISDDDERRFIAKLAVFLGAG